VVAPEDEEVFWVFDFVGEEEADGFEALLAPVDVVAEEEVVGVGRETAILEQAQQVVVLAVNVAYTKYNVKAVGGEWGKSGSVPQILMGASSSSRMGWEMKISRAFMQRLRISWAPSWTCLPGRLPRTSKSLSIMLSTSMSPIFFLALFLYVGIAERPSTDEEDLN
jgi:hypothetical protein